MMSRQSTLRTQVSPASNYEGKGDGFVVEYNYGTDQSPQWAIPAWDEWGRPDLECVFATREAAETALSEAT